MTVIAQDDHLTAGAWAACVSTRRISAFTRAFCWKETLFFVPALVLVYREC